MSTEYIIDTVYYLQTHSCEGHVPDHIVSKTPVSRSDHSETSPCIIRLVQLFTPVLLTFTLCVNRNLYNNCVDKMHMVGRRSCKCHPFTLNPIYFKVLNLVASDASACYWDCLGVLLKEVRVFALKGYMPPEPTVNIHIY